MKKYIIFLAILILMLCLAGVGIADKSYLTPTGGIYNPVFSGEVNISGAVSTYTISVAGAFSGNGIMQETWFEVTSGDYSGYIFGVGWWQIMGTTTSYEGSFVDLARPDEDSNIAFDGEIRAVGNEDILELTSFLGTQYSGAFYINKVIITEESFSATVPLTVYEANLDMVCYQSDLPEYIGTTFSISGLGFDFNVEGIEPFVNIGMKGVTAFIGNYDWSGTDEQEDGSIYMLWIPEGVVGAVQPFKGVIIGDPDNFQVFVEHANTAPPIPIPSTLLLFGSGLFGLIGIRRK